jgi:NADPH2:quinone reductase
MRVVEIGAFGPPQNLRLTERSRPEPGAGEVLIAVHASGVNRPDVLQRLGHYPPPAGASDIPGLEVAGTIATVGDGAGEWRVGDRVCALVAGGGYADYCVAPAGQCLPIPAGCDFVEAAALPETVFTVWHNVFERGALQQGETLLIQGGASGIGTTAIQLAKALGARVVATAGNDYKCARCVEIGADLAINYRSSDFAQAVMSFTQGRGADVVLDMVAGSYVERELTCLAEDGRLVIIAVQGGRQAHIDCATVMRKRLTITGSTLRARAVEFKSALARRIRSRVWPLVEEGALRPLIHRTFDAADAASAHALMESGEHVGKIVLTWNTV